MNIKQKLIGINFLQFFIWGSWLTSLGIYLGGSLHFSGSQIGSIFLTMGIASLFMPALLGIVADKWLNAEKVLGLCHLIGAGLLYYASTISDYDSLYYVMLLISMFYMPTIALDNSVSYTILEKNGYDVVKDFPPIRVWGTVGFIVAMWVVNLLGWHVDERQFHMAAIASFIMGAYSFTLPTCPLSKSKNQSLVSALGLDAFVLFKQYKMAVFFLFAILLGAALQITNAYGEQFIHEFHKVPEYADAIAVKYPSILMSISQMSETLFILTIPFFLRKFGIKQVMLMSMLAWVLRFGLFGIGYPTGLGLVALIASMIIYGLAFDFFNISGSLFVENEAPKEMRSSAQGLFIIMTNGLGTILGMIASGQVIDAFTGADGHKDWSPIWLIFAAYALVVAIVFQFVFKYKHDSSKIGDIKH